MLSGLGTKKMLKLHRQDMYKTGDFSFFPLIKFHQGRLYFALDGVVSSGPQHPARGSAALHVVL
jgi:hypothetical protein